LQQSTLSNGDRVEMLYREHVKKHGAISKDEFLGRLLGGKVDNAVPARDSEVASKT
jgi:hypothetical protein